MRILVDYRPALRQRTGVGEYAHYLSAALVRRRDDADVTLFSSSWKDRLDPDAVAGAAILDARVPVSALNFAWHRLSWPPVENFGAKADVAWSLHPLMIPSLHAAQVVTVHDLYFLDHPEATDREVRRDYPALAGVHARRADAVIVNSNYTKRLVETRLDVPAERVTICYPGPPAWRVREEPPAPGPILHVGTIEPRKNAGTLVDGYLALAESQTSVPPLVFAGRIATPPAPPPPGTLRRDIFDSNVRFLGYVNDEERLRLYREASVLVIASWDEGFGLPALEAMTIGVPVVAADRGSLPEVLGDAGILVDPDDPSAIAVAVGRLLGDPVLRREQAAKGVKRASTFSWERSADHLLAAFRDAIARRAARS